MRNSFDRVLVCVWFSFFSRRNSIRRIIFSITLVQFFFVRVHLITEPTQRIFVQFVSRSLIKSCVPSTMFDDTQREFRFIEIYH